MEIIFSPQAKEDLKYWKATGNKAIKQKIEKLLIALEQDPYRGIGKPEQLKHNLAGTWSRRITKEHRMVYEINHKNQIIILDILSLKGHYY